MSFINEEVKKFTSKASMWWSTSSGPFKMLHQINPTRLSYITSKIKSHYSLKNKGEFAGLKILDVGCGGGICSIPLAKLGAQVTGIDAGDKNIEAAQKRAEEVGVSVEFKSDLLHNIKEENHYDVVLCLEVLEHVANPNNFFAEFKRVLKKDGLLIVSTINRTIKAKIMAICIAEYLLQALPRGTHEYNKFLKPSELILPAKNNNLDCVDISGITYDLFKQKWEITKDIDVNYITTFIKKIDLY